MISFFYLQRVKLALAYMVTSHSLGQDVVYRYLASSFLHQGAVLNGANLNLQKRKCKKEQSLSNKKGEILFNLWN